MNSLLQEAIAGEPVMVTLGRESYPLAYPMQAVILYKRETALLDRERVKNDGRPRLTREEKRSLRDRRLKLLADADCLRPDTHEDWLPQQFVEFDALMDEASALKIAYDEDAGTGDSLYDMYNWRKISPDGDPERLLLALWVGLHIFVPSQTAGKPDEYVETLARQKLGSLVDLGNGGDLTMAISKALSAHLIAASETPVEDLGPNPQPPSPAGWVQARTTENPQPPAGIPERRLRRLETHPNPTTTDQK
jgi:hypothetical protein